MLTRFLESGRASSVSERANEGLQVRKPWFSDASGSTATVRPARDAAESFYSPTRKTGEAAISVAPNNAMDERALAPEVAVIVFANEFFDALPVEILGAQGALRISAEDGHFVEIWVPPAPKELEFLDRYGVHPEPGERIEVPLLAQRYMSGLAASMRKGIVIAVDYGYTRPEQLAGRHRGTLMAYRQHSASPNPYSGSG